MSRDNRRNYYRLLHVQPDAPTEIIKASYRTLMQRLRMHPDLGGDDWNASLLNEAYAVLVDPDKRAAYDADRDEFRRDDTARAQEAATQNDQVDERPSPGTRAHGSDEHCPFCHTGVDLRIEADSLCRECASPLARASNAARGADWIRSLERIPKQQSIQVWPDWPQAPEAAMLVDLSLSGLRFRLPRALGENHFIKIDSELFASIARVVHCRPADSGWELGAEFYTLRFRRSRGAFVSAEA
jgi:curved DNA-binding protein CbpA